MKTFLLSLTLLFGCFNTSFAQYDTLLIDLFSKIQPSLAKSGGGNCGNAIYRTYDGTCNNASQINWGAAKIPMHRAFPSQYGPPKFIEAYSGQGRANPRAISNYVAAHPGYALNQQQFSAFVFTWGQFLDHDITETPSNPAELEPILLPTDEPLFRVPIMFNRSLPHNNTGVNTPREQTNNITAWIDASNVYGSDASRAAWLRTFQHGKLKTSYGNLLPFNTYTGEFSSPIDPNAPEMAGNEEHEHKVFVAGDVRANEQPGLAALHTLFVREHNQICDGLVAAGYYDDEGNYQIARKIVGAYMQSITYNEFLPALGIQLDAYEGYKPHVLPNITNTFATAAFRFGHTMVNDEIILRDINNNVLRNLSLAEAFFRPRTVAEYGLEPILMGLSRQLQEDMDLFIVDALRNFLFAPTPDAPGLDLVALNIQRGRDHGLADYNSVRMKLTGKPAYQWSDITSDPQLQANLRKAYGNNLNDIDLWVGLLAEDHLPGSSVGASMHALLKDQFQRLRDADRFYYAVDPVFLNDPSDWKSRIENTTFSDLIRRNTLIYDLPYNVFYTPNNSNQLASRSFEASAPTEKTNQEALDVFPNPSSGLISVELEEESLRQAKLEVVNAQGQIVHEEKFQQVTSFYAADLDLSHLAKGVYFVLLRTNNGQLMERIVLQE